MGFYRLLDTLGWPKSYLGKILFISFVGVHVPMVGAVLYMLLASDLPLDDVTGILIAMLVATLLGTVATLLSIYALLAPVRQAAFAIKGYLRDRRVPALPTRMRDEAGVLMANVQEGITRLDAAVDAARAQRDTAAREKEETFAMLSSMSHELRTPLNHIIGFAEMMSNETLGPLGQPIYKGYANDIGASGGQLLQVVQSVLDLSELEAGKVEGRRERISLSAAAAQAVSLEHLHAQGAGVALVAGAGVSSAGADLEVEADPRALKQMLIGLLQLAIEGSPPDGLVNVSVAADGAGALLTVGTGGRPFSQEDLPPGLRAADAPSELSGGGFESVSPIALRLAVVCSLARLQGAAVSLDQSSGGKRLMVRFPECVGGRGALAA